MVTVVVIPITAMVVTRINILSRINTQAKAVWVSTIRAITPTMEGAGEAPTPEILSSQGTAEQIVSGDCKVL